MSSLFRVVSVFLLCGVLTTVSAAQAPPRPQFRSNVELIQFQVTVADRDGNFASGLSTEDFEVQVNGASRDIVLAYEVNRGAPAPAIAAGSPGAVDSARLPAAAWRQFVLFFDAAFNSPRGVREARKAALAFLDDSVLPDDLVSVVTYSVAEGVRMIVPLTRDRVQVRAAVDGLGLTTATRKMDRAGFLAGLITGDMEGNSTAGGGANAQLVEADAVIAEIAGQVGRSEFLQYTSYVAGYAEELQGLGELMQVVRGRKHVLFFTEGFDDRVLVGKSLDELAADSNRIQSNVGEGLASVASEERFGSGEVRGAIDDAIDELLAADTLLHMVDVSGVGGGRDAGLSGGAGRSEFGTSTGSGRNSLTVWSEGTGGSTVWNTNDVASWLDTIEQETRHYYVLALPRRPGDPDVLELDVRVRTEGVEVTSSASRFAPASDFVDMTPAQRQAQLAEFITKGLVDGDLVFDTAVFAFAGENNVNRIPVVVEVPWSELEALAAAGSDSVVDLEIVSYVVNAAGTMIDLADNQVSMDVADMGKGKHSGLPFRHYDLMWSGPGDNEVRTIVRDAEVGRVSARTDHVAVPARDPSPLRLDGLVAIDWTHPGLLLAGIDPAKPPAHKQNGPVAYPFVVNDIELTPSALLAAAPGGVVQCYAVAHGLARNPFNGQTQWGMAVQLLDPSGREVSLDRVAVIEESYDPDTGGTQLLIGAQLPKRLDSAYYELSVIVTDQVAGTETRASVPVWVGVGPGS